MRPLFILASFGLLVSCREQTGSPRRAAEFSGRVATAEGKGLDSVEVRVGRQQTFTDRDGRFRLIARPDSLYVLNIRKRGFGLVSRVFTQGVVNRTWTLTEGTTITANPASLIAVTNTRTSSACQPALSATTDWTANARAGTLVMRSSHTQMSTGAVPKSARDAAAFVNTNQGCSPGVSVSIPASSIVDAAGNAASGNVSVTVTTVDQFAPDAFPGDFTVGQRRRDGFVRSYGAGGVDIFAANGQRLQLKKGARATIRIPVANAGRKGDRKLPPRIPFLRYDEATGKWIGVGTAVLDGSAYVGDATHFSEFNMDQVKTDQACLRINSAGINGDYRLEVTIPTEGEAPEVRTVDVPNTVETLHALYNLPTNAVILLRPFKPVGGAGGYVPLSSTVTNTGMPQDPTDPNRPVSPYTACQAEVTLTEALQPPVLHGPTYTAANYQLLWEYEWTGLASTGDGYSLEHSTTSATSGFSQILNTVGSGDRASPKTHSVTLSTTGFHWYRVRANDGGWTPYSNVIPVREDPGVPPSVLRIYNDLYDQVDTEGNDWGRLNTIIRVRIGPTLASVLNSGDNERMWPFDDAFSLADARQITPSYLSMVNYMDFEVAEFVGAPDYYVYIQTGWWDFFVDTYSGSSWWTKHTSVVLGCSGQLTYKFNTIRVFPPYLNPEPIKASDYLPHQHWTGTGLCG